MKKIFCLLLLTGTAKIQAQEIIPDSIQKHIQIFSLAPISKKVDKVNGLVFGLGHIENKNIERQTINGINIEVNPAPAAGVLYAFIVIMNFDRVIGNDKIKVIKRNEEDYIIRNTSPALILNGLNISSGFFFTSTNMNGLNVSVGNKFNNFNGLSVTALGTIAGHQNGLSIGVYNANNDLRGLTIGVYNQSYQLKGLHLGLFNQVGINKGVQIGVLNKSNSKGFQLGLWNINNKRSMPFLNW
ncbi:LA_2272 family surface repeat-containing protein [Flavobacterium limi]|uniref:DUF5723 domain-containing protein n=1 Tax=Flavobacterium limi TaxID=2045105 RepID=A0ABQ1TNA5_9FLAO|nr:hypothetical protein [Flavobacterium limi]GGE99560.1 hypothetical protein GCM10011518_06230 [Flavobacterium limi]